MKRREWIVSLILVGITLAVFLPVLRSGFVELDDYTYVVENPNVNRGLTVSGLKWAFTSLEYMSNWHPMTWISHMLDVQIFGLKPWGHHLTNLLLHAANAVLLFGVLRAMTGALWRSAIVGGLFAVHPLHVESVAWVAERKDLLSTFFWALALLAYLRYVSRPKVGRYLAVASFFALGLMAKPMVVTLPLLLLLLDGWPLGRIFRSGSGFAGFSIASLWRCLLEKVPLLVLSAVASIVTLRSQAANVASEETLSLTSRVANSLLAYVSYSGMMLWPIDLAIFYPHPGNQVSLGLAALAGMALAVLTAMAFVRWRRQPYLAAGWLWYLGTLVPTIGLVQVGSQAMADRYTYVPLVGLFLAAVWGGEDLARKWRLPKPASVGSVAVLTACALATSVQLKHWRDDESLFRHALAVTSRNWLAHYNLGNILSSQGKLAEAAAEYEKGLAINSSRLELRKNLGNTFSALGRFDEAAALYREVLRIRPDDAKVLYSLGFALYRVGKTSEATVAITEAVQLQPEFWEAHVGLGNALARQGRLSEATDSYRRALALNPTDAGVHFSLGSVLLDLGIRDEARRHFQETLRLQPGHTQARIALERMRSATSSPTW